MATTASSFPKPLMHHPQCLVVEFLVASPGARLPQQQAAKKHETPGSQQLWSLAHAPLAF